jgi:hypothetical protein
MRTIRFLILAVLSYAIVGCRNATFFQERQYSYNGNEFIFQPDKTFTYRNQNDGQTFAFSRGTWRQEGNKLFLFADTVELNRLPSLIDSCLSNERQTQFIFNILPRKHPSLRDVPYGPLDLFNVELVLNDSKTYPLLNECNLVTLKEAHGYLRAYPKQNVEQRVRILNDTLVSRPFHLRTDDRNFRIVNIDCNPYYFARVKSDNDILRILNGNTIRWKKTKLKIVK